MIISEEEFKILVDSKLLRNLNNLEKLIIEAKKDIYSFGSGLTEQLKGTTNIIDGLVKSRERLPYVKKLYPDVMYFYDEDTGEVGYVGLTKSEKEKLRRNQAGSYV